MKLVFADTSFYAAFLSQRDVHHAKAMDLAVANRGTILTTEFVILELANSFAHAAGRATVTNFVRSVRNDRNTTIVPASSELVQRGFEMFSQRPDKEWSLTDCISFVVMQDHGVAEALTADGHFEQAGFKALLRE
jgi:predicted nucleic acid-binding protein